MARWYSSGFKNLLVPWTTVQPSQKARRWQQVGCGIAIASALAFLWAAILSTPFDPWLAVLAGAAGVAGWAAVRERVSASYEIAVSAAGEIELRENAAPGAADGPAPSLSVSFAAPWLISLRFGTMLVPIWPDCLPPSTFRQLWVHLRWGRTGMSGDEHQSFGMTHSKPVRS